MKAQYRAPVRPICDIGRDAALRGFRPRHRFARRALFFSLIAVTVGLATAMLTEILAANGLGAIEIGILCLFFVNFIWIAFSFWTAVAGFVIRLSGREPIDLHAVGELRGAAAGTVSSRTAIVVPVYNEDPHRVFAGIDAVYASLAQTRNGLDGFDVFILSDTTRDDIAAQERAYWEAFCEASNAFSRVFYRRRSPNTHRKAGNVADFCKRWGYRYEHMIVLDADSLISGETIVSLVILMEANPRAGLIQTVPMPIRQETLFGRAIQFSSRLVSPMLASGLSFWHMGESNYYGHNAIIRVDAFMQNCGLPELPGKPPLGGEIHSHDYVEAALLRRGGWRVYLVPDLEDSFEELPANILAFASRDRRWCQGNLQHLRLLGARGLHWVSRVHLLQGAFAYLSSPLWVGFLMLSTADIVAQAITGHRYFEDPYQLYPNWPVSMLTETVSLFLVTLGMLFTPKILSLLLVLLDRAGRAAYGGWRRAVAGLGLETLFSVLIAPVMGCLHSYFIASLLVGRGVAWNPQNRSERGLGFGVTVSSVGILMFIGIAWLTVIYLHAPGYVWWVAPVLAGLILSIPITVISSRPAVGLWLRRRGLMLTPEETAPTKEMQLLDQALERDLIMPEAMDLRDHPAATPPARFTPMPPQSFAVREPETQKTPAMRRIG